MISLWLFVLGLAFGSFINVISLRYNPEKFILNKSVLGGRSACPKCGNKLNWFELIPLFSFAFLRARCRKCHEKISWQYPLVELISGLIFISVPAFIFSSKFKIIFSNSGFKDIAGDPIYLWLLAILFLAVFSALLLLSLIDIRLKIIPDEINIFLVILGIVLIILSRNDFSLVGGSFLGSFSALLGFKTSIWLNHGVALLFGGLFFGAIIFATFGRGMGLGDLKLAIALGVIFGWPDIVIITAVSFIVGSLISLPLMISKRKKLKSFLPFGPFLAIASILIFLFGHDIIGFYFQLFAL